LIGRCLERVAASAQEIAAGNSGAAFLNVKGDAGINAEGYTAADCLGLANRRQRIIRPTD
jgi:hypothetical protein